MNPLIVATTCHIHEARAGRPGDGLVVVVHRKDDPGGAKEDLELVWGAAVGFVRRGWLSGSGSGSGGDWRSGHGRRERGENNGLELHLEQRKFDHNCRTAKDSNVSNPGTRLLRSRVCQPFVQ